MGSEEGSESSKAAPGIHHVVSLKASRQLSRPLKKKKKLAGGITLEPHEGRNISTPMTADMSLSRPARKLPANKAWVRGADSLARDPQNPPQQLIMNVIFRNIPGESVKERTFKNPFC